MDPKLIQFFSFSALISLLLQIPMICFSKFSKEEEYKRNKIKYVLKLFVVFFQLIIMYWYYLRFWEAIIMIRLSVSLTFSCVGYEASTV